MFGKETDQPAAGAMGAEAQPAAMPCITCPNCGGQISITAAAPEAAPENEQMSTDMDESQMQGEENSGDEFDQRAEEMEQTRRRPFRDRAGVARALREAGSK